MRRTDLDAAAGVWHSSIPPSRGQPGWRPAAAFWAFRRIADLKTLTAQLTRQQTDLLSMNETTQAVA